MTNVSSEFFRNMVQGIHMCGLDMIAGTVRISQAQQDGCRTCWRLSLGLPGSRRLTDQFHSDSKTGYGKTFTIRKRLP